MLLTNDANWPTAWRIRGTGWPRPTWQRSPDRCPEDVGRRLITGIELEDGVASADKFRVIEQAGKRALVEITLHEGRKHIVRRLLAEAGHPVSRLVRTRVGPVTLGSLRPGSTRALTTREIGELYAAVGL